MIILRQVWFPSMIREPQAPETIHYIGNSEGISASVIVQLFCVQGI